MQIKSSFANFCLIASAYFTTVTTCVNGSESEPHYCRGVAEEGAQGVRANFDLMLCRIMD